MDSFEYEFYSLHTECHRRIVNTKSVQQKISLMPVNPSHTASLIFTGMVL